MHCLLNKRYQMFFFKSTGSRQFASVNNTISLTLNFNFESGCSKISYTSIEPFCYATQLGKVPYSCALGILRPVLRNRSRNRNRRNRIILTQEEPEPEPYPCSRFRLRFRFLLQKKYETKSTLTGHWPTHA
jgi:hypothetical protein